MYRVFFAIIAVCLLVTPTVAASATLVFSASGDTPGAIQANVDSFRLALGSLNPNLPINGAADGRREINWDGVPDGLADPNAMPGDLFNGAVPGLARGIEFTTPGSGFEVSANAGAAEPVAFSHSEDFTPFSSQRMFRPVGSNILDVLFFDPGDQTSKATTRGFGAVFNDVDVFGSTLVSFFDIDDTLLMTQTVRQSSSGGLSFLGVSFDDPVVARVRIVVGNALIPDLAGPFETGFVDGVVMDDFIYGEPIAAAPVPLPSSILLLAIAMVGMGAVRRTH